MTRMMPLVAWAGATLLFVAGCAYPAPRVFAVHPPVDIDDVVKLSHAGVRDEVIVELVDSRGLGATLSVEDVARLKDLGVAAPLFDALVRAPARPRSTVAWDGPYWIYGDPYCPDCSWDGTYVSTFASFGHHHHVLGHHPVHGGHASHFGGHHAHHGGHH